MRLESSPCGARGNALWGRGGRIRNRIGALTALLSLFGALAVPAAGIAGPARPIASNTAFVPAALLAQAQANPNQLFHVIVQGRRGIRSNAVASDVTAESGRSRHVFASISGAAVDITGKRLVKLAGRAHILSITPDQPVQSADYQNAMMWAESTDIAPLWNATDPDTGDILGPAPQAPAIAIVDSGIDATRAADFGARVVASVNVSSLAPRRDGRPARATARWSPGIAAGAAALHPGAAPNAPLVDVRTARRRTASR